jgi:sRNA-binding protein
MGLLASGAQSWFDVQGDPAGRVPTTSAKHAAMTPESFVASQPRAKLATASKQAPAALASYEA